MKTIILSAFSVLAINSFAGVECVGETAKEGKIIRVSINTVGTMGYVQKGSVQILDKTLTILAGYELEKEEIPQYFEDCIDDDCEKNGAIVGLQAYEDTNYNVSIRYFGKDYTYESKDLVDILRDKKRVKKAGNSMRVWKGDQSLPYENSFYIFKDIVCSLDHDV